MESTESKRKKIVDTLDPAIQRSAMDSTESHRRSLHGIVDTMKSATQHSIMDSTELLTLWCQGECTVLTLCGLVGTTEPRSKKLFKKLGRPLPESFGDWCLTKKKSNGYMELFHKENIAR